MQNDDGDDEYPVYTVRQQLLIESKNNDFVHDEDKKSTAVVEYKKTRLVVRLMSPYVVDKKHVFQINSCCHKHPHTWWTCRKLDKFEINYHDRQKTVIYFEEVRIKRKHERIWKLPEKGKNGKICVFRLRMMDERRIDEMNRIQIQNDPHQSGERLNTEMRDIYIICNGEWVSLIKAVHSFSCFLHWSGERVGRLLRERDRIAGRFEQVPLVEVVKDLIFESDPSDLVKGERQRITWTSRPTKEETGVMVVEEPAATGEEQTDLSAVEASSEEDVEDLVSSCLQTNFNFLVVVK